MKDPHIRDLLRRTEVSKYINDPYSRIVEEMKIPVANARIDMAVINGHFHGYEIKGASDTLKRLPNQLIAYSYVFDYLTVITEEKYYKQILDLVPDWVGISICCEETEDKLEIAKPGELNFNKNGFYLSKLLRNDELIDVLLQLKIPFKKRERNWVMCELVSQNTEVELLSKIVREKLKFRSALKSIKDYEVM